MQQKTLLRILWDVILIGSVFFLPWWAVGLGVLVGAVVFSWYFEALFLGLYFDVFFGYPSLSWYTAIMHTVVFLIPVIIAEYIKPRINYEFF